VTWCSLDVTSQGVLLRVTALADGADLFIIHVEATDEAGHAGDVHEKIRALENWDSVILTGLVPALDRLGPWRLLRCRTRR